MQILTPPRIRSLSALQCSLAKDRARCGAEQTIRHKIARILGDLGLREEPRYPQNESRAHAGDRSAPEELQYFH